MSASFDKALELILKQEGGYVNNKNDAGGETMCGISTRLLASQDIVKTKDVKDLTADQISTLYQDIFWSPNKLSSIVSQRVADMIFGLCVNMGSGRAIKLLQKAVGEFITGEMTAELIDKINNLDESTLIGSYKDAAASFYKALVSKNSKYNVFVRGWLNRIQGY